jgi:RNA polymerase sigma factor (sigma-70 family)
MSDMHLEHRDGLLDAHHFLQENAAAFREIAGVYVVRLGLARGGDSATLADEVFQDAVLEVLAHPEQFATARQPRAWFMGVMANIVKRKRAGAARRQRFEVVISDLRHPPDIENENDLLDYLFRWQIPGPEQAVEADAQLEEMLALVSTEDATLLRMALVHELQAEKLGELLNVTPNTARVRVHRALSRLRLAWKGTEANRKRGKRNG